MQNASSFICERCNLIASIDFRGEKKKKKTFKDILITSILTKIKYFNSQNLICLLLIIFTNISE